MLSSSSRLYVELFLNSRFTLNRRTEVSCQNMKELHLTIYPLTYFVNANWTPLNSYYDNRSVRLTLYTYIHSPDSETAIRFPIVLQFSIITQFLSHLFSSEILDQRSLATRHVTIRIQFWSSYPLLNSLHALSHYMMLWQGSDWTRI